MIKVSHLFKSFGPVEAVSDISFEIEKGQVIGLLGPNGAGKTTTMRLLTGFIRPDKGQILINDFDMDTHKKDIQKLIGYLPENCPLYEDLTVAEHLYFTAILKGIPKQDIPAKLRKVLGLCSLEDRRDMIITHLSKGYKQRTGLAAALIGEPEILILDEPTSGLDPNQILDIRKLLVSIAQETKATIILSTHIMQEAESICDRVIIISFGKMVADGSIATLAKGGKDGIEIEFETDLTITETKAALIRQERILSYTTTGKSGRFNIFRAVFDSEPDNIPGILENLIKSNIPIYKFNQVEESLETIFSSLTRK